MLKKKMLRKREGQNVSWFFLPSPHENPLHNIPFINMQHRSFFFKATGESCYVDRPWKKKKKRWKVFMIPIRSHPICFDPRSASLFKVGWPPLSSHLPSASHTHTCAPASQLSTHTRQASFIDSLVLMCVSLCDKDSGTSDNGVNNGLGIILK